MPTSAWHYITPILTEIDRINSISPVRTVLDVGCGSGKWGYLVRDLLDFYTHGVYYRQQWTTRIEGIEVFERYHNPIHDYAYDRVHWGDATGLVDSLGDFDVIIAMEVIEHLDKASGEELVAKLAVNANRVLILSFPPEFDALGRHTLEQKERHENPHEEHRAVWHESDLRPYAFRRIAESTYAIEGALREVSVASARDVLQREQATSVLCTDQSCLE
jgi:predicted TPR repeat methyltransferase